MSKVLTDQELEHLLAMARFVVEKTSDGQPSEFYTALIKAAFEKLSSSMGFSNAKFVTEVMMEVEMESRIQHLRDANGIFSEA